MGKAICPYMASGVAGCFRRERSKFLCRSKVGFVNPQKVTYIITIVHSILYRQFTTLSFPHSLNSPNESLTLFIPILDQGALHAARPPLLRYGW